MSARGPFQDKPALRVEALSIVRGDRVLFADLAFAAQPGDYVEVRGANGAGKTSLLRAIAGFLRPHAGAIHVEGAEEPALALHYLGHLNGLKPNLNVRAHVRFWAELFGARAEGDVVERIGLTRQAELPVRALSQGQARRLALARLLAAPRPIWLLDEPSAALDVQGRSFVSDLISVHCRNGGIILAAVHEPLGPTPTHAVTIGA